MRYVSVLFLSCLALAACTKKQGTAPTISGQPGGDTPLATSLTVKCDFPDGWAAVVPRSAFRADDEYTMQALIGMAEEPEFWRDQEEYSGLVEFPARRCSGGVTFDRFGSDYVLLIGRANTYDGEGYGINGLVREAPAGGEVRVGTADLVISWSCISCPRLYVWTGTEWELRGEILVDVIGAGAEQTQRRRLGKVRVEGGEVRVRLAEEEDEVSYVDALVLEVGGVMAVPAGTLSAVDGARAVLSRGDAVELRYQVGLPDGEYQATAVATGYYVPLAPVR